VLRRAPEARRRRTVRRLAAHAEEALADLTSIAGARALRRDGLRLRARREQDEEKEEKEEKERTHRRRL
jgi:hypothetical protein